MAAIVGHITESLIRRALCEALLTPDLSAAERELIEREIDHAAPEMAKAARLAKKGGA